MERGRIAATMLCTSCGRDVSAFDGARFCPFCAASLVIRERTDGWIGRTLADRFTIVSHLAEGGIGRIYVAEQPMGHTKRRLALKMLLPEHASDPEMVRRFFRECELVSLIEHPNVVRIYDFGEAESGVFYIAMELVPGKSFAAVLREEGPFALGHAVELLSQVCRGVAAAHDRGIVHRDLKPDNLMLVRQPGEAELVKVLDFGIAKAVAGSASGIGGVTRMGVIVGSPAYMSPEQFLGEGNDVRSDVYALGVVSYELLTGARPFEATDMTAWAVQHMNASPRPFETTAAGALIPDAVRRTILRAMAKSQTQRPATARDFMAELVGSAAGAGPAHGAARRGETVAAPPAADVHLPVDASVAERELGAPARPRARGWPLVFAALAAGAAGSAAVVLVLSRGRSTPAQAQGSDVSNGAVDAARAESPVRDAAPADAAAEDVPVAQPTPPLPRPIPGHVDTSACEQAIHATTCADGQAAQRRCPDAAGKIHHVAHDHVAQLCGGHPHE
jgi:hypothetical protein